MEVIASRRASVGAMTVRRALPRPRRRTVGAWCFADHFGPIETTPARGADVGPHPHLGLQTVSWLTSGALVHRDSLGTEQLLRAGELNLMTAGRGVSHAEEVAPTATGRLEGIQLWVAQPEATRNGPAAFSHHADLPVVELDGGSAVVVVGVHDEQRSPAKVDTPLLGLELTLHSLTTLALEPTFEHALVVLDGTLIVEGAVLEAGQLGVLDLGRDELGIEVVSPTRAMLLGGAPFSEQIAMWWNFVGRDPDEFGEAYASWEHDDGRFGTVDSRLPRVLTTPPTRPRS